METPNIETMAEVICNLAGDDPNDPTVWSKALAEAEQIRADGTWFDLHPLED